MISATILAALMATCSASRNPDLMGATLDQNAMASFTRSLQMASVLDFPEPTVTVNLTEPIALDKGKVFDGEGRLYQMMSPNTPMFRVFDGTVQNLVVGAMIGDGIRCFGDCSIIDVFFEDVGAGNAISLSSSTDGNAVVKIEGGGVRDADDVAISLNSGANVTITDYVFDSCRTGIHVSETFKTVGRNASVTITDSTVRFTEASVRLALVKKPVSGLPAMMEIMNVDVINRNGKKICEGPQKACKVSDVRNVDEASFVEEDDDN